MVGRVHAAGTPKVITEKFHAGSRQDDAGREVRRNSPIWIERLQHSGAFVAFMKSETASTPS